MTDKAQSDAIRALNDEFRRSFKGGLVMLTAGIIALGGEAQARIFAAVQAFDDFSDNNDPWAEHDFGKIEVDGECIFFKLDYYDLTRGMHSEDPSDPTITERIMTIMLASEY
jgi:hypothetical protein